MRYLAALVLLLAVFGASTQCVAACLTETQQKDPPCHRDSSPDPCQHSQLVANTQAPADQPVILVTPLPQAVDPTGMYLKPPALATVPPSPGDRLLTTLRL